MHIPGLYIHILYIYGGQYFGTPSGRDKSIYQSAKGVAFLPHHGTCAVASKYVPVLQSTLSASKYRVPVRKF